MKKTLLTITLCAAMSAQAGSIGSGTTTGEGYSCLSEKLLDDWEAFKRAGDKDSMVAYFTANKCVDLKPGLHVTVHDGGLLDRRFKITVQGYTLWAQREVVGEWREPVR